MSTVPAFFAGKINIHCQWIKEVKNKVIIEKEEKENNQTTSWTGGAWLRITKRGENITETLIESRELGANENYTEFDNKIELFAPDEIPTDNTTPSYNVHSGKKSENYIEMNILM